MIDETKFKVITAHVMSDEQPLAIEISIKSAWLLLSGVQLVTRHPGLHSRTKEEFEHIGRQIQEAIRDVHPEADELMEMGWNPEYDVPR